MSRIGPPPGAKKKSGFGCQCSMPRDMMCAVPPMIRPTAAVVDRRPRLLVGAAHPGVGRRAHAQKKFGSGTKSEPSVP